MEDLDPIELPVPTPEEEREARAIVKSWRREEALEAMRELDRIARSPDANTARLAQAKLVAWRADRAEGRARKVRMAAYFGPATEG